MADSVFTPEQEARINDLLIEYLSQNGASIDAGVNVTELTGDALTDENLKKLTIPSILPNTNQWAYTSLQNMMAPIIHAISQLQTQDSQVQAALSNATSATTAANSGAQAANTAASAANTAATGAESVNATLAGTIFTVTNRNGQSTSINVSFDIYRTYPSVAAMNADAANVDEGRFVMIATVDPTSAENARMYVRNGASAAEAFSFICDLDQASSEAWADWLNNMKPVIQQAITNANTAATNANTKAQEAQTAANLADTKAGYAETQGLYAKQKGDEASLVDANLNGNILTINNRSGSSKSLNVKGEKGDKGEGIDYSTMTPAEKQELTEYVAEEIAQEGGYVLYPVDESSITPSTIFSKNSILSINGVIYRAKQDTNNLPFTFVIEGNRFVVQTVYGHTALVRSSDTVSNDWAIWADASNDIRFRELEDRVARLESILR